MFEAATRKKFRFPFKGMVSVEDLWDLKVEDLDTIFKTLNSQKKKVNEESLLNTQSDEDKELNQKIEIIKHIVSVKLAEAEARKKDKETKAKRQKIMSIMDAKQNEALENKSLEELQKMLEEMD